MTQKHPYPEYPVFLCAAGSIELPSPPAHLPSEPGSAGEGSCIAPHLPLGEGVGGEGGRRRYRARFVRAGEVLGPDRKPVDFTITPQVLQAALAEGKFDRCAVFIDHAAFFEQPSLDKLVGGTSRAAWNEADQAVEGVVELYSTPLAQIAARLLDDLLASPAAAPDVGLSMVFYPIWEADPHSQSSNPKSRIIGITHIESIDLVFQPAADGRILQALSSHCAPGTASRNRVFPKNPVSTSFLFSKGTPTMIDTMIDNPSGSSTAHVDAAQADVSTLPGRTLSGRTPSAPTMMPSAQTMTPVQIVQTLFGSGLPLVAQERLAAQQHPDLAALQAAIEAERRYLASVAEPGVVQLGAPPRGGRISGMLDSLDRITLATEALICGTSPAKGVRPLTGIRELYHLLSGDYEMTGVFQPERIGFANVTSSTMAGLVANALNKVIANEFVNYPQWWTPITIPMDFLSLQQVKWISLGGIGELPTVAEGAAYTELTWDDNTETATFYKKGGYLGLTMEAIDKDDTGRISAAPRALAQAAWLTLSKSISSIFTSASGVGPNLADGNALFYARAAGTNVGSTALSITEWNVVRTAMRKFTELNSSERIGGLVSPKFLLVPPDLEQTALRIMATEFDYTYALSNGQAAPVNDNAIGNEFMERISNARKRVIVVDLWTDANNWAAVADPNLWPTIGIGYRYGRVPEIFSVASPTAGLMFTNDTLPIKVRFVYATGPMDWRGMYKENVA